MKFRGERYAYIYMGDSMSLPTFFYPFVTMFISTSIPLSPSPSRGAGVYCFRKQYDWVSHGELSYRAEQPQGGLVDPSTVTRRQFFLPRLCSVNWNARPGADINARNICTPVCNTVRTSSGIYCRIVNRGTCKKVLVMRAKRDARSTVDR